MFSSLRGFLDRHKKKFIVASAVAGGTVLAVRYAQRKLREWQEQEARAFLDMTRKKQHFDSTEATCNQAVLSLTSSVHEAVMKSLDTDDILQSLRSNPDNKAELWGQLKVLAFARASSVIYSYTILVVALRIQLNIVCGYLYKDSFNGDTPPVVSGELKEQYLSICQYFISEGITKLSKIIEGKVRGVIETVSLKQKFNLRDTEQLFWSIQAALCTDNADPLKQMVSFFINDTDGDTSPTFKTIINETVDLMESDEVVSLCVSSVSRGFSLLFDQIAEFILPVSNGTQINGGPSNGTYLSTDKYVNVSLIELPLIKLIPIINGLVSNYVDANESNGCSFPQALIQQLLMNEKLKVLGANVYEVFSY